MQRALPGNTLSPSVEESALTTLRRASSAITAIAALGFVVRAVAAERLSAHLDEASTVLAAQTVAERGVPILPSGTVYLQGATLSYMLAPLVWLGFGDLPTHLTVLRTVSVVAGVAAIYLTYLIGASIARDPRVGAVAAFMVAIDPVSVQWSAHIRMYSLLQALTLGVVWVSVLLVSRAPSRWLAALLIALFWLAVFTHIGAASLLLPMAVVAVATHGRGLVNQRRDVVTGLTLCGLAIVTLLALNQILGPARAGTEDTAPLPFARFVGDHLLDFGQATRPDFTVWQLLFSQEDAPPIRPLVPAIIMICSTVLVWSVLRAGAISPSAIARDQDSGKPRRTIWTWALIAFYWLPILVVVTVVTVPRERYLSHVHPLGYVIVVVAAYTLLRCDRRRWSPVSWPRRFGVAMGLALPVMVLLHSVSALNALRQDPVVMPNYVAALLYVDERKDPRDLVLVTMPPPARLVLDDTSNLRFLAGPENRPLDQSRVERYTRRTGDGRRIDYWLGVPAIASTAELRQVLSSNPGAWLVLEDEAHLRQQWALAGPMATLIDDMTDEVYRADGGALVLRVSPAVGAHAPFPMPLVA